MTTFQLVCLDTSNQKTLLTLKCLDGNEAIHIAEKRNFQVITCVPFHEDQGNNQGHNQIPLNISQLASFCGRLAPLLEMNIPIRHALGFMSENSPDSDLRHVCGSLKHLMDKMSLPDAIKQTKRFPPILEGVIQAGIDSSDLSDSLHTMSRFYAMLISMQNGIKNALIQPAIALVILTGFFFFSIFFTIPQITKLITGMGMKPDGLLKLVLGINHFFQIVWPLLAMVLIGIIIILRTTNSLRRSLYFFLLRRWNLFRSVFHNLSQTSILYALSILVKAQVPQTQIFPYLIEITRGSPMELQLQQAMHFHQKDGRFSRALERHLELDPEIIFALRIGEETSTLHIQAERMARIYEKQTLQASESLGSKLTPFVIILTASLAASLFCLTFGSVITVCLKLIRNGA